MERQINNKKDLDGPIETEASGPPTSSAPGNNGTGQLLQGFLESSNVDLDRESVRLHYLDQWRAELLRAAQRE